MTEQYKVTRIPRVNPDSVRLKPSTSAMAIGVGQPKSKRPKNRRTLHKHDGGCVTINGNLSRYANVQVDGQQFRAHRVAYATAYGPFSDRLHVHHACGNKGCVNPQHLRLVTRHNHGMTHSRHKQLCEMAIEQGLEMPQWIEVVEDLTKSACEEHHPQV